jgi:hypothetical protein
LFFRLRQRHAVVRNDADDDTIGDARSYRPALMNYRPELVGWKAFPCGSDTSFHFQPSSDREPWKTAPLW